MLFVIKNNIKMTNEIYQNSKAWPFEEARKILAKIGEMTAP